MTIKKSLLVLACSSIISTSVFASADKAIAAAEASQKAAAKVGYEWRDTAKMIKEAKKLAKQGKTEQAIQLANKAQEQGQDALAQYHSETKRYQSNY